jgi:hypothetical protein
MKTLENEQSIRIEAEIQKKKQGTGNTNNVGTFAPAGNSFMSLGNDAFSAEEKMELPF